MSKDHFPKIKSVEVLGELSAWTSVVDVMAAACILESRTVPGDQVVNMLIIPLEYEDPPFEQIFAILLGYLIDGYVVPSQKIKVCRALDPKITEETEATLQSLRFRPSIQVGNVAEIHNKRAFIIKDQPAIIELIRAPLNCLMGLYLDKYEYTKSLSDIVAQTEEKTGGYPTIFHRPYADACLPSFIEAACFFEFGLEVGTRFGLPGQAKIETAYRAVNVQMVPPVDLSILEVAINSGKRMLNALR